jgi:hypothetical protein
MTSVPALSVGGVPVVMIGTAGAAVPPDPVEVVIPPPSVVPVLEAAPPLVPAAPDVVCPGPPVEPPEVAAPPIRPEQAAIIIVESMPTNTRDDRCCTGAFIDVLPLLSF